MKPNICPTKQSLAAAGPLPSPRPRTGAEALVETLKALGVKVIFGVTGAAIMPVYDAFFGDEALRHVTAGHEQGGIHMAEGLARATGRPGVVLTTSGPGATNLVTGLANARLDSTPLLAITGQVPTGLIGRAAFQEVDIRGVAAPITKQTFQPARAEAVPQVLREAFALASSGRPGPVLIDLPKDVSLAPAEIPAPGQARTAVSGPRQEGHPLQIKRALNLLRRASRPVMLIGGGLITAGAAAEALGLAELLDLPVASSLMGLGGFPGGHRLFLGLAGMHGLGPANLALHHADAVLCLGTRLGDRLTGRVDRFAPGADLIHVDVDAAEIGKNLPARVPIVGHLKPVLRALLEGAGRWESRPDLAPWQARIEAWRRQHPLAYRVRGGFIAPQKVIEELGRLLDETAVIATGVGQHQMWTAQYYRFRRPRTFVTSGGLGTMGFGLPAAIGAQIGRPETRVVCVDGDGSFLMTIQELATAVRCRLPLVVVVINNSALGMVRQWQRLFLDGRLSETGLEPPPFDRVARAFGALGRRVTRPEELGPGLEWALKTSLALRRPAVLDVAVDPEACVLPMVPAGQGNDEFIPCQMEEA